jgi:acyl carrier protein
MSQVLRNIPASDTELREEIKRVIVDACELDIDPTSIGDNDTLIGSESKLGLDSLAALQAAVALSKRFGRRIHDGNHARRVMKTVDTLAGFVRSG